MKYNNQEMQLLETNTPQVHLTFVITLLFVITFVLPFFVPHSLSLSLSLSEEPAAASTEEARAWMLAVRIRSSFICVWTLALVIEVPLLLEYAYSSWFSLLEEPAASKEEASQWISAVDVHSSFKCVVTLETLESIMLAHATPRLLRECRLSDAFSDCANKATTCTMQPSKFLAWLIQCRGRNPTRQRSTPSVIQ